MIITLNTEDENTVSFNSYYVDGGDDFAQIIRWLEYSFDYGIDSVVTETFLRVQQQLM